MNVQEKIRQCIDDHAIMLDLSYMNLKELPLNLPSSLLKLNCSGNQITHISSILPISLQTLDCSNNQIRQLPFFSCHLRKLDCANNCLESLPSILPSCLTYLDCSNNKIRQLPEILPANLGLLDCSNNFINQIPFHIDQLIPNSLWWLDCSHNFIKQLPVCLPYISYLYCNNNQMTYLPNIRNAIVGCSDNKYLHISKKNASDFKLIQTPNYNKKAGVIQRIWKAIKCKHIMITMIHNNNNVLHDCFKSYGDINIIHLIIKYLV